MFDAKYKIETSEEYQNTYGGIGPKEEDINTMHLCRDAIVYKNKKTGAYDNCVFGAFVLFSFKDELQYKNHNFYKSIEEVNIGGIPFLPKATGLMEEFLDKLINESSYSIFERSLDSLGRENYIKNEYFKDRTVLVGSLRNKEQLKINLKGKFYHTKCSNVNLAEHNIKFVALAQSKRQFAADAGITYYGKVVDIKVVKRNMITDIPSESEEDYYVFKIEEWKKLDRKIEVKGYQVVRVMYTTEYLLNNAAIVTELCIKSKEEYRVWEELKRISSLTETEIVKNINRDSSIEGFSVEGMRIFISDGEIHLECKGSTYDFSVAEFSRRPREVMGRIFNIGRGVLN
ncbi:hypothetical protein K9O30_06730 [Clostridium bowmanii]|uniref:nuclease domain-containing protein n=1 Tax=Clostridium bowmanii TaxID=132925 RepID=UPI001C0E5989|nr:nuclease domain-containing protein [Clostridium bowmanii]MBU3191318.1 hypothetical protein [Clostridium bowmanii]MCA1073434.1 hypothetical protein [Clostridium bowmanii]